MAYPAVVLDHSALVTHVECDPTNLRIKFLHRNALNTAKSAWTMPKFVMTSFYEGCGQASSTGERDYLLVHALDFKPDALQVDAKIKHIGVKEAIGDENPITLDMGTYTPTSADGNVGFDSGNAPPVPNNGTAQNTTGSAADFDVALDNSIGYTSLNATSHVKRFLGLEPHAQLQGRGFFSKIWKAVKKVVQKFIPSWTLTPLNKNININLGGGNIMTPWNKKGYQLYSTGSGTNYVRLYCVDCGVKGMINVKATVTFNLIGIISAGSFSANGNMAAGLGLGVDAHYATSIPGFSKTLVVIPLSPFAIPGLITIGPHLDLGVGANAHFSASGKLYAGVGLSWPAIHAQLNLLSAPSASGFSPTVTHNFEAEGKISLGADVTLQGVAFENQNVLVAVDAGRNQLYPMLCVFGDTDFPKLFLAKDPHAGIDALKSDTNVATITGVKPEDCDFIPLISV
ncbi:hypothetical protein BJ875DRAFT_412799 [Amylocarpus encephaloides]|uniref:Peptidase A1 domain-containing protein n=1 Tax=Amylocarpus encephaloides TaxID=45428 RepID=A0A9P7Y6S9_9HELO|nr:hypothetical protein BJ875DRAFT_412799 [Amylocarpus encephaloides]